MPDYDAFSPSGSVQVGVPDSSRSVQLGAPSSSASEPVDVSPGSSFELRELSFSSPNPPGGRPRMSLEQRAKIFMPFDPLEGFTAALRAVELELEAAQSDSIGNRYEAPSSS